MADVITQQQMQLLPEYQERYLKDLLANVYRTEQIPALDEEGTRFLFWMRQAILRLMKTVLLFFRCSQSLEGLHLCPRSLDNLSLMTRGTLFIKGINQET